MNKHTKMTEDELQGVHFVQAISVDINGLARGKTLPRWKLPALLEGREEVICLIELFGSKSEIPFSIKELSDCGYTNVHTVPDESTLAISPWCDDNSLAMVFCDSYDIASNRPCPFNPRLLAKLKLKELEDMGYKLLIGVENEFRLFDKKTLETITKDSCYAGHFVAKTTLLPFMRKLSKQMEKIDIEMDSWNLEYGAGQIEVPLKAYFGMDGVDKVWLFREMCKYAANDMDMVATFMTTPLAKEISSGMHINHSLLRSLDLENVMQSGENDGKLSEVGQNWLAGLMRHTRALTAILSPTVNCYRRNRAGFFSPKRVSWDYFSRGVGYRVKTSRTASSGNFIEARTPSSACNIYLAIAAMTVAGMDGIKNELRLIEPGDGDHCESLPITLEESLTALREDKVLCEGLGEKFVDWYIKARVECDIDVLKKIDLNDDTKGALQLERDKYFHL